MRRAETVIFQGRFQIESFLEFVRHRAERLALTAGIEAATTDRIEVSVAGEEELLDAFELACSLGPIDCLVRDHRRLQRAGRPASAETIRGRA
jgi:acylphosphatase